MSVPRSFRRSPNLWERCLPAMQATRSPCEPRHRLSRASSAPTDSHRFRGSELAREGSGADDEYSGVSSNNQAGSQAAELLILGAPLNHAGRNPILIRWENRQGCRFSRGGPGMALRGGPPNQCRITGMPSLGEGPSGGARALWLLSRFSKVTRRKGATNSSRYRSNGYTHTHTHAHAHTHIA